MPIPREEVRAVYVYVLGREPENDAVVESHARNWDSVANFRLDALRSDEFRSVVQGLGLSSVSRDKWVKTDIRNNLSMWVNLNDSNVSYGCLWDNWEEPAVTFVLGRLRTGDVFLDIGANIGWFTLLAAQKLRELGAGHVVAFEPRSDLFTMASRSVRENGLEPFVTLHQAALADRPGALQLAWNDDNAAASYIATQGVHPGGRHETVRVVRLDDVEMPRPVKLIKCDAEGAEGLLFAGAQNLLQRDRPLILAELNIPRLPVVSGVSADQFLKQMRESGYSCRLLDEKGEAGAPIERAEDSNDPAANVLFLPD